MRHLGLFAVVVFAIAVACSGGDDGTETPTASVTATPTSEPTSTASATTTATPTSEPTDTPTVVVTPIPDPQVGERFGVVRVHRNDPDGGLNLREEANAESSVVTVIPPGATEVIASGGIERAADGATWFEVAFEGETGWVNANYLTALPSFAEVACGDPGAEYVYELGDVPLIPMVTDPAADSVFSLHQYAGEGCERTVVTFGRDFSFDADLDGVLQSSEGVPADVLVMLEAAAVDVVLPEAVTAASATATESFRRDNGLADLLVVRSAESGGLEVVGLWDRNRGARVFALQSPGRLVIDTVDAPTGSGLALGPLVGDDPFDLTVVRRPINVDVNGPAPVPPIEVTGYARPFEATTEIELRTAPASGASPGSGQLVNADWSGSSFAASCGPSYAVMTTDWLEVWGEFSFTIEALAPGTYELFVGEFSAEDGQPRGVYHVFTVGGATAASC